MSAAATTTIVVDNTTDARAKTLAPPATLPITFAFPALRDERRQLEATVAAWENEAISLPLPEMHAESFTPGLYARQANACGAPEFAVALGPRVWGGWRTGGHWVLAPAMGEVECEECDGYLDSEARDPMHERIVCRPCARHLAAMDGDP